MPHFILSLSSKKDIEIQTHSNVRISSKQFMCRCRRVYHDMCLKEEIQEQEEKPNIDSLPVEILQHIFEFLNDVGLITVSQVSLVFLVVVVCCCILSLIHLFIELAKNLFRFT